MVNRRDFLRLMVAGSAILTLPKVAFAKANTIKRFVLILQRGAADGLNTVIPYADPAYTQLRKSLAIDVSQATKLNGLFALHPALQQTASLYAADQAILVHAVASPYRSRSHFDAQNILETGGSSAYQLKDGWLNRLLTLLPTAQNEAIAIAPSVPMALRGSVNVASYAPSKLPGASDDLMLRVAALYEADPQLHAAWSSAVEIEGMADRGNQSDPASLGKLTGSFLTKDNGPRIAMIETNGWDTHNAQATRLNRQLSSLDILIGALKESLGDVWANTTVFVCTEFGRTAAINGTQGTDHGTASAAMILGGGIKGGRVVADCLRLNNRALFEGRDLKPTLGLNHLVTALLAENYGLDPEKVGKVLFPSSQISQSLVSYYK